jgi:hypothetical protein
MYASPRLDTSLSRTVTSESTLCKPEYRARTRDNGLGMKQECLEMHAHPDYNGQSVTFTGGMHMPPNPWEEQAPFCSWKKYLTEVESANTTVVLRNLRFVALVARALLLQLKRGHAGSLGEQIWPLALEVVTWGLAVGSRVHAQFGR